MSYSYGKSIVTDGLVFYVDAANENSYPGTGTTWSDLIVGSQGTLTNGPTYSSDNGGIIDFDGSNDYTTFGNIDQAKLEYNQDFTISFWFKSSSSVTTPTDFVSFRETGGDTEGWVLRNRTSTDNNSLFFIYDQGTNAASYITATGNHVFWGTDWHMVTLVHSGTMGDTDLTVYKNGSAVSMTVTSSSTVTGNPDYTAGQTLELAAQSGISRYADCRFSNFSIYHKALSASEVLQNYNALKNRFV